MINSKDAWVIRGKKLYLNPKYKFVGKVDMSMPNMIVTASDKSKPKYRGDVHELNKVCKDVWVLCYSILTKVGFYQNRVCALCIKTLEK